MRTEALLPKQMIEGRDYIFRDDIMKESDEPIAIQLVEEGVVYRYLTVQVLNNDDPPMLHFKYEIISNPFNTPEDHQLIETMGHVLSTVILEGIEQDDAREDHSQKSDSES